MTATIERRALLARRRLDVDDYYRMAEAGIIRPTDRLELIDGEIIELAPVGSFHAGTTSQLVAAFANGMLHRRCLVRVQNPLRLDSLNEPQPDLMLLKHRADFYKNGHPGADDVLLLVEVADGSLNYDRSIKLSLYARHGVPEVWIIDLQGGCVLVYKNPEDGRYALDARLTHGPLAPSSVPELRVDVGALVSEQPSP